MKIEFITKILIELNWQLIRNGEKYSKFKPPIELKLPEDFYLYIPNLDTTVDFEEYITGIIRVLVHIYEGIFDENMFYIGFKTGEFTKRKDTLFNHKNKHFIVSTQNAKVIKSY